LTLQAADRCAGRQKDELANIKRPQAMKLAFVEGQ